MTCPMNTYLDFLSKDYHNSSRVQFVPGGNSFTNPIQERDIIPLEERDYYVEEELVQIKKPNEGTTLTLEELY